jgi:Ni/Co efflux regulator RcnB
MIDALSIIVCLAASHVQAAMAFSTKQNRCQSRLAVRLIHSSRLPDASASDGRPESKKGAIAHKQTSAAAESWSKGARRRSSALGEQKLRRFMQTPCAQ